MNDDGFERIEFLQKKYEGVKETELFNKLMEALGSKARATPGVHIRYTLMEALDQAEKKKKS